MGILEEVLAKVDALRRTAGRNVQDMVQQPSLYIEKVTDALRNTNRGVVPVASNGELTNRSLTPSERVEQTMGTLDFGGGLGVIKPKGGNWLSGQVEGALSGLKKNVENIRVPAGADGPARTQAAKANAQALNQWIEGPLTKYIKRDMASPNDPIRKLADQGILHVTPEQLPMRTQRPDEVTAQMSMRQRAGFPTEGMAQTDLGKAWESAADRMLGEGAPAGYYAQKPTKLQADPWLATVPPETTVHSPLGTSSELGFNHIVDELSNSLREGRLRPEQLQQMGMERAVRHVAEVNALRAKKAQEALMADMEGMPLHKDYPTEGMSWRQLKAPDLTPERIKYLESQYPEDNAEFGLHHINSRELQKWLTQEGDAMGHCVGGYCDDVQSGASNIYSLRDAKGQPHVTIETSPTQREAWLKERAAQLGGTAEAWTSALKEFKAAPNLPPQIVQIKGKANAAPKAEYLPFIQDFVRSGRWSDIGDAAHTGLSSEEIDQILRGKK